MQERKKKKPRHRDGASDWEKSRYDALVAHPLDITLTYVNAAPKKIPAERADR